MSISNSEVDQIARVGLSCAVTVGCILVAGGAA